MQKRYVQVARAAAILLSLMLLSGLGLAAWLIAESRSPEPGAQAVLMGLPLLAMLMLLPSVVLLAIAIAYWTAMPRVETIAYVLIACSCLLPGLAMVVLG